MNEMMRIEKTVRDLGHRIRQARKQHYPEDDQQTFCRRLGISRGTLRRVEQGDSGVTIGIYLKIAWLLDSLGEFDALFQPDDNLLGDPELWQ